MIMRVDPGVSDELLPVGRGGDGAGLCRDLGKPLLPDLGEVERPDQSAVGGSDCPDLATPSGADDPDAERFHVRSFQMSASGAIGSFHRLACLGRQIDRHGEQEVAMPVVRRGVLGVAARREPAVPAVWVSSRIGPLKSPYCP